jgi:putative hydrolase of the HAD superfamily
VKASRPDAIVFDIGQVLLRLDFSRLLAAMHLAPATPGPAVDALNRWELYDAYERGALPESEFRAKLSARLGCDLSPEAFRDLWNSVIVGEVLGIAALVETLAAEVPLYALTNSNETHVRHCLERYPFFSRFRRVFSSHQLRGRKPEPEVFAAVAKQAGVAPQKLLFVDDREENVAGALRAGYRAEVCRRSPEDLHAILERHGFSGLTPG